MAKLVIYWGDVKVRGELGEDVRAKSQILYVLYLLDICPRAIFKTFKTFKKIRHLRHLRKSDL
jgi:hypothetical protein